MKNVSILINPTTGVELDASPASATLEEADAVIALAHDAFPAWRDVAPGERARLLRAFAALVDEHLEELAQLEVLNAGHTIGNARWEAGNVRDCLNYYSAAPERLFGRQIPVAGGTDVTFHEPLGVVGIIVPWNFPMPIAAWGFAPALAAGNTVVLKPAELTPLTAIRIGELADSTLISRKLRKTRWVTVASPSYLARRPAPKTLDDLAKHNCLCFVGQNGKRRDWTFAPGGKPQIVAVSGNLLIDHGSYLLAAAAAGMGISQVLDFMVEDQLRDGSLVEVLASFAAEGPAIHAVATSSRARSAGVRAFITFLVEAFRR